MMLANGLSSRVIQVSLALCVLIVGGSLLHFWHVKRTTDAEYPRLDDVKVEGRQGGTQNTGGTHPVDFGQVETPSLDAEDTSSLSEDTDAARTSETDAQTRDSTETRETDTGTADDPVEEVEVSPYGFGPYPELPEGWSPNTFPTATPQHELLARVRIKLISEGINAEGAAYRRANSLIYPIVKGTVYVEWRLYDGPTGVTKRIRTLYGHPADSPRILALEEEAVRTRVSFPESQVPSDIKLVPLTEGGINPYEFLNLE